MHSQHAVMNAGRFFTRSTYLYGLSMAGLLFLLKSVEYRFLVYDLGMEYLVGFLALVFTLLGLWMGWKLTSKRAPKIGGATGEAPSVSASQVGISPREEQVLRLIAAGHSNQ